MRSTAWSFIIGQSNWCMIQTASIDSKIPAWDPTFFLSTNSPTFLVFLLLFIGLFYWPQNANLMYLSLQIKIENQVKNCKTEILLVLFSPIFTDGWHFLYSIWNQLSTQNTKATIFIKYLLHKTNILLSDIIFPDFSLTNPQFPDFSLTFW